MITNVGHGIKSNFLSHVLSEDGFGYVHSIFTNSFNVLFKDQLIHFSEAGKELSSFGIGIPSNQWKKLLTSIKVEDRVKSRQNNWMIYARQITWKLELNKFNEIDCKIPKIDEINPKLIYNLKNNFQSLGIDEKTELVANERDQLFIEEFLDANWENHEFFQQFVAHFLGRGIGLTPSGDDMLMGMIMMSNSFSMPMEWSSFILTQLERTQTTKVSDAYYKALLSGYISTQFVSLLQIIKDKKMTDWNEAISRIADYGHTSGWDTLFGIFLFLQKLEKSLS